MFVGSVQLLAAEHPARRDTVLHVAEYLHESFGDRFYVSPEMKEKFIGYAEIRKVVSGEGSDRDLPVLNELQCGSLLEVMKDLLYQIYVRKGRLQYLVKSTSSGQRFTVLDPDTLAVKDFIERNCGS